MRVALITLVLLACGGKPAPRPPPPLDAKTLARQIDGDMHQLAAVAQQHRGNCAALTDALRPLVATMRGHANEAERMVEDLVKARELRAEMDAYAKAAGARVDRTAQDLAVSFRACKDAGEAHRLESEIAKIPTY